MSSNLLDLKAGTQLADGKYEVLFPLDSTGQFPYVVEYSSYIVKEVNTGKCKTLQVLSKTDSEADSTEVPPKIQNDLNEKARSSILCIQNAFKYKDFLCSIQDLRGPNLSTLITGDALSSASWTKKVFRGTLEALLALHSNGVIHGDIQEQSIVITYPNLNSADAATVKEFYKPAGSKFEQFPAVAFNSFGSGADGVAGNLEFQIELQNLRKAWTISDEGPDDYLTYTCPPPELFFEGEVSQKTDIWKLGIMMTNIIASAPEFDTIIGGRAEDQSEQLFEAQRYLGPLPSQQSERLSSEQAPQTESLLSKIRSTRLSIAELKIPEDPKAAEKSDVFSSKSLELATDLLKRLMAYDPKERLSAKQALSHEFFK